VGGGAATGESKLKVGMLRWKWRLQLQWCRQARLARVARVNRDRVGGHGEGGERRSSAARFRECQQEQSGMRAASSTLAHLVGQNNVGCDGMGSPWMRWVGHCDRDRALGGTTGLCQWLKGPSSTSGCTSLCPPLLINAAADAAASQRRQMAIPCPRETAFTLPFAKLFLS
jgi:hypothetical protein